jgi:hypothetical protein
MAGIYAYRCDGKVIEMFKSAQALGLCAILLCGASAFSASVILNEYNAVDAGAFLGGGTAVADEAGGRAADSFFGRIPGNGGDWFELVVIADHLDMRNWKLDIYSNGLLDETLDLTAHSLWSDIRSGTIITVSEDVPSDIGYNPAAGDWWINVQANDGADGLYIEASSFPVGSTNWQLRIRNAAGAVVFGPAGEGVSPASGVGGDEVFKLEANPTAATVAASPDYDGGKNLSTFGSPNQWGMQNLNALRTIASAPSTLTLLTPNGSEMLKGGDVCDILWSSVAAVLVEFSIDNGLSWSPVYPPNAGNTGTYSWLVPRVNAEACLVRITNTDNSTVFDLSNAVFTIYQCGVEGDVTGDCLIDLNDLATMAASWLECGNPYAPDCL